VGAISLRGLRVAKWEQELQEKEEETKGKHTHERSELESHAIDLSAHKAALATVWEHLWKTREDFCNCELTISSQEGIVECCAIALASQ
jgi:hypothetical protein